MDPWRQPCGETAMLGKKCHGCDCEWLSSRLVGPTFCCYFCCQPSARSALRLNLPSWQGDGASQRLVNINVRGRGDAMDGGVGWSHHFTSSIIVVASVICHFRHRSHHRIAIAVVAVLVDTKLQLLLLLLLFRFSVGRSVFCSFRFAVCLEARNWNSFSIWSSS